MSIDLRFFPPARGETAESRLESVWITWTCLWNSAELTFAHASRWDFAWVLP